VGLSILPSDNKHAPSNSLPDQVAQRSIGSAGSNVCLKTPLQSKTNSLIKQLYQEHNKALLTFISSKCGYNTDNAHEIMQEVFMALSRHIASGGHLEQPRGLIYKIAKTKLIDHYRRQSVRMQDAHDDISDYQPECEMPSQERIVAGEQKLKQLKTIVMTLPPKCQKVFVLRVFEEMKYDEIAKLCEISQSMVEKHMNKAMKIIKEKMLYPQN